MWKERDLSCIQRFGLALSIGFCFLALYLIGDWENFLALVALRLFWYLPSFDFGYLQHFVGGRGHSLSSLARCDGGWPCRNPLGKYSFLVSISLRDFGWRWSLILRVLCWKENLTRGGVLEICDFASRWSVKFWWYKITNRRKQICKRESNHVCSLWKCINNWIAFEWDGKEIYACARYGIIYMQKICILFLSS